MHAVFVVVIMPMVIVVIVVIVVILLSTNAMVARPMTRVASVIAELEKGNFNVTVPYHDRSDEIGAIAKALEAFKKASAGMQQAERDKREAEHRAGEERNRTRLQMADEFEKSVGSIVVNVTDSAGDMEKVSRQMRRAADESSEQATVVAAAAGVFQPLVYRPERRPVIPKDVHRLVAEGAGAQFLHTPHLALLHPVHAQDHP